LIDESGIERVAEVIRGYLARHPAAADSAQGIAQWWLPALGIDVPVDTVERALERLVERGAVRRADVTGGAAIYRAARSQAAPDAPTNGG
jgi:hypothetical protein